MPRRCMKCSRFLRSDYDGDECPDGVGCHGTAAWQDRNRCKVCNRWISWKDEICPEGTGCRGPYRHHITPGATEAAREARLGKADPHKLKVTGGRRRLAEPVAADAPWWHHRAYFLRTDKDHRWSYQKIADELGKPYRQVYKALNRERVAETNRRHQRKNREELSRKNVERRRRNAPKCEQCGNPMNDKYVKGSLCLRCIVNNSVSDYEAVRELYEAGWKHREIDEYLGKPPGSSTAITRELRRRGLITTSRAPAARMAA